MLGTPRPDADGPIRQAVTVGEPAVLEKGLGDETCLCEETLASGCTEFSLLQHRAWARPSRCSKSIFRQTNFPD